MTEYNIINKSKRINKNTDGLTMVELIVTMVVLSILLAVTVASLYNYTRYSAYKRNSEHAQSIFLAAQSALSHYRITGKLDDFREELVQSQSSSSDESGNVSPAIRQFAGITDDRPLCYLYIPKGLNQEELKATLLYQLLHKYVFDNAIYQAAIRIEFDPVDGTVFSVCYSDQAEQFEESNAGGEDGIIGILPLNRTKDAGKKMILGYYDTTLSDQRRATGHQLLKSCINRQIMLRLDYQCERKG